MKTIQINAAIFIFLLCISSPLANALPELTSYKTVDEMDGTIEITSNKSEFISLGNSVIVKTTLDSLMPGDRLEIYKSVDGKETVSKDTPLEMAGEIAIINVKGKSIFGIVSYTTSEIPNLSYIKNPLPKYIISSAYNDFLKRIVSERLQDPLNGKIKIALMSATNESGNVTTFTESLSNEFRNNACIRKQFDCVPENKLNALLEKYGVNTSTSIGHFIRNKLIDEMDIELLFTAETSFTKGVQNISVTSWDLKRDMRTRPYLIPISDKYFSDANSAETIVTPYREIHHGHLTISLNNDKFTGERDVDYLFSENLNTFLFEKYKNDMGHTVYDEIEWTNVFISINSALCRTSDGKIYFNDVVRSSNHIIKISATPSLLGDSTVILGKPIEKEVEIIVPPDTAIRTEIIVKNIGTNTMIVVDSSPSH